MQVRITMECHSPEDEYLYLPFSIGEKLADMILKPPSYIIVNVSQESSIIFAFCWIGYYITTVLHIF